MKATEIAETSLERPAARILSPATFRGLTLKNRLVVSPMCTYSAGEGLLDDFHLVHLGRFAMGGAGLRRSDGSEQKRAHHARLCRTVERCADRSHEARRGLPASLRLGRWNPAFSCWSQGLIATALGRRRTSGRDGP